MNISKRFKNKKNLNLKKTRFQSRFQTVISKLTGQLPT